MLQNKRCYALITKSYSVGLNADELSNVLFAPMTSFILLLSPSASRMENTVAIFVVILLRDWLLMANLPLKTSLSNHKNVCIFICEATADGLTCTIIR